MPILTLGKVHIDSLYILTHHCLRHSILIPKGARHQTWIFFHSWNETVLPGAITRHHYMDRRASCAVIIAISSLSIWQEDSNHNSLCGCLLLASPIVRSFSSSQRTLDLFAEQRGVENDAKLLILSRCIIISNRHFLSVVMAGSRDESCWDFC